MTALATHAYLIKGYLLAKDAPKAIIDSIEAIIEGLARPEQTISSSYVPALSSPVVPELASMAILAEHSEPTSDNHDTDADECDAQPASEIETTPEVPPKKKRNFSPEARAAAAERMRAMQARKKAEREASSVPTPEQSTFEPRKAEPPTPAKMSPSPKPKPLPAIDHERLITVHNGYAGKRDPGQPLTDDDWPDIKVRLAKSPDRRAIAGDYDVDLEDLNFFIASCQRREGKSPGEAPAPPSSGASGAARPRW